MQLNLACQHSFSSRPDCGKYLLALKESFSPALLQTTGPFNRFVYIEPALKTACRILVIWMGFLFSTHLAPAQCTTGAYWPNGPGSNGSLRDTAIVDYFDTVFIVTSNPTSGSFQGPPNARPAYWFSTISQWGGMDYTGVQVIRGGGRGAKTYFKFSQPKDSSIIHLKVSNVRGDGFLCANCEHQKITGYLAGVKVGSSFKALLNGAIQSGDNLNGGSSTSGSVQSEGRIFFNGPVDSIIVQSVSTDDFIIAELYGRCYSILPVSWLSFEGSIQRSQILLNWKTAAEFGNKKFVIEKKIANYWNSIGEIAGAGLSNNISNYSFTDNNPFFGNNTYRIRQVNNDGTVSYSKTLNLIYSRSAGISIYPNPASSFLHIQSSYPLHEVQLMSTDGKMIERYQAGDNTSLSIQLKNVVRGVYILKLISADGEFSFRKISISK